MEQKWLKSISRSALFRDIGTMELEAIISCLNPKICRYKKNEFITMEGEPFTELGILLEGEAAVVKENAAGNRVIITILKPGDLFGEMAAFSGLGVWPGTVLSQENSTVLFLPPGKIIGECEKVCISHKRLIYNMLRIISEKALMLNRKVEYFTIKSLRGKLAKFLMEYVKRSGKHTFMMPLNRNELADFLNVSRPSLSREMCRMRDEGLIEFHRAAVQIKNLDALKTMIE